MADSGGTTTKRPRISVDIEPALRRQLRLAAAHKDVTIRQYVVEAIVEQLRRDSGGRSEAPAALTAANDPLLAELWDNELDAAYDRL